MEIINKILANVGQAIMGKDDVLKKVLLGILCNGHLLIEDVPGIGKTTMVKAFAKTLGCTFKRIQFTPDLMPSDIIGITLYDKDSGQFTFKPGPIMTQIILADEINRTSPKTQSSLLEAMAERQITVDGVTYKLPSPFIVMATQNPIEYEGTFPLPEAQLDRFTMRITIGYPDKESERRILQETNVDITDLLEEIITPTEIIKIQEEVSKIYLSPSLETYIVNLVWETRNHKDILLGISPRGAKDLYRVSKGQAFLSGRSHVLPDDIKRLVEPVFSHRLLLKPEGRLKGITIREVISDILNKTHVPVVNHVKG